MVGRLEFLKNNVGKLKLKLQIANFENGVTKVGLDVGQADRLLTYFDVDFYRLRYPDVAVAGIDPLRHYLEHGWREGRDPSPSFNTLFYQKKYAQILGDQCPLVHYVEEGRKVHLSTSPIDDLEYFISMYSGQIERLVERVSLDPSLLEKGVLHDTIMPMFSATEIRERHNLPESVADFECLFRYLVFDFGRGQRPGPLFDGDYYCTQIQMRGLKPPQDSQGSFLHWLKFGIPRRISPLSWYSDENYLEFNSDLRAYPDWLFLHFVRHGLPEGRRFLPTMILSPAAHPQNRAARGRDFVVHMNKRPDGGAILQTQLDFWRSQKMEEITRRAISLEPEIEVQKTQPLSIMAPWHDENYRIYELIRRQVPNVYENVILAPFCKLGGADFVCGLLAHSVASLGKTIVIRTDQSDWARPDWFPADMDTVDLSEWLQPLGSALRKRVLYELIRALKPKNVFNVNSRAAFETFADYGARLQKVTRLFCYYFCSDRTSTGQEAGYPVNYFANVLPYLTGALLDTHYLKDVLERRWCLPDNLREKLVVLRTPQVSQVSQAIHGPLAALQVARRARRTRPIIMWAGRLDRQKRFDLVVEIARAMPDVLFECWGKAVLDAEPPRDNFPPNLTLHHPFKSYEELPLLDCDGLLYTSAWDGMPTILIELAGLGMPIVASAVGGVPELIDDETGWPIPEDADLQEYVARIRAFLGNSEQRIERARALQERARTQYNREAYDQALRSLLEQDGNDD